MPRRPRPTWGPPASQPIAAARPAGIASTMSDDPTLALSAGTLAPPPVLRAIPIHELASGIHTVGRWSSGRLWKLAAASSAARPDLSFVATTVTQRRRRRAAGRCSRRRAGRPSRSSRATRAPSRSCTGAAPPAAAGSSSANTTGSAATGVSVAPPASSDEPWSLSITAVAVPPATSTSTSAPRDDDPAGARPTAPLLALSALRAPRRGTPGAHALAPIRRSRSPARSPSTAYGDAVTGARQTDAMGNVLSSDGGKGRRRAYIEDLSGPKGPPW